MINQPLTINGITVKPGTRVSIDLPTGRLYTHTPLTVPVHVVSGRKAGPRLFISAAIHGDEINGVEIIRRLRMMRGLRNLRGTLVLVPVVVPLLLMVVVWPSKTTRRVFRCSGCRPKRGSTAPKRFEP